MNTLELRIQSCPDGDGSEVRVLIDGRDLVDLVREVEEPWARRDGQPQLAGAYSGLWPGAWRDLPEQDGTGRAAVLACECGEVGCWPLHVRIRVSDSAVIWSEFAQPCRPAWRHEGLGPFTFERTAYEQAVRDVAASSRRAPQPP